jgi:CubicO group peptidase (beta-lactamase class C family)
LKRILAFSFLLIGVLGAADRAVFPGADWQKIDKPESAGYMSVRLAALRTWLASQDTTAMLVSVGGKKLFEYGDLSHLSYLASVRKSILAMLYGKYVENGKIDLKKTLEDLEMDDIGGLQPGERKATVEHLLTARSGIFHPASNPGDATAYAPPRGSVRPGTYQMYNNWDFNAAGAAFEKMTGLDIYDALAGELAAPIGMQDFKRDIHQKSGDTTRSKYQAYHMTLSTRDMARVGLLMLRGGEWNGKQVVPRGWVEKISRTVTPGRDVNPRFFGSSQVGYGYLWWIREDGGALAGAYEGRGAGGQYIAVIPQLDMVIAHKTDLREDSAHRRGQRRQVTEPVWESIVRMLIASRCLGPCTGN